MDEQQALARFPGFGPVALTLFPDPVTGHYKDDSWRALGEELHGLLTAEEYDSAKRTTFNAFYTSPLVIRHMHSALVRLGLPPEATVLEPGCGSGNFMAFAPESLHFIGVELDPLSGRIARARHPGHDIRIENFRDTTLPDNRIDAVIGNVPFADVKLSYDGQRRSLHDFFFAKSVDALKPGGVLGLVTSHYTLDKQNPDMRRYLGERADFLGAIRLPSDAFKREGTRVVTDIIILRRRSPGAAPAHVDNAWLDTAPLVIDDVEIPINRYFLEHPDMVLGDWSRQDRLYGAESAYSLKANGDLDAQLAAAIAHLPERVYSARRHTPPEAERAPLPPLERHVTEGSFFVAEDLRLMQVQHGEAIPVMHGKRSLTADGTMMGKRLAALTELRDYARRVLQSQNEDWPEAQRHEARFELGRVYDRFVEAYGPINKTTFSTTADGGIVRRMPNLVKFRDDPDAMLVMALEDYDEITGQARKTAIMEKDVVGRLPPVTSVQTAEEGLLASLNHLGRVDLEYIASLYHAPPDRIIEELGDLIYQDTENSAWQTADVYLSGNVRAKLAAAEAAGAAYARNAEALRAVQPEDVLPGDIDANLGAPWIPARYIQQFAAHLFGVPIEAIHIGHLPKDALWSVSGDTRVSASVAASTDFGTDRIGGVALLEQALNLKSPAIYDTITTDGKEERVLNQEATLAARDKQKQIKDAFKGWIFSDPDRTETLVRRYNDTYNNLRLRSFDGSHLDFPGMNRHVTLASHQKDAVWRCMSSGNTLLAHAVGAGKTFEMAASGMKMKQAGLIHKPMYVVPNHMLEQFGREFMQLYLNAHLLIAGKEDFTRERRKLLTAKIASGEWDGVIVTHSSFERIGMSADYQAQFLRAQIAEYDALLTDSAREEPDRAHRNIIKTIEKQKARREERLKDLLAAEKKDDGLVFDELGVDHLFIDESHYFKNLETPTKMDRVAGIQTGGSERAFDLYMKCRYLDGLHAGRGVTFATGTPISNTMVEMYTIQRFLDPHGLAERGIEHFDAWAATFGEVVDMMEISPDGSTLRPRSRFAKFSNLPELQQMFRAFADVKTPEMLDLPRPTLQGGKAAVIACPMSEAQCEAQTRLIERYDAIRSGQVKPWEDNALAITTDGRKLALDGRMLSSTAGDDPNAKINAMAGRVYDVWQGSAPSKGAQLIFCDLGVRPNPWGFSAYQEVIDKLVKRGIPAEEIAAIGSADTDAKKQALFDQVRAGTVRVLLGSTQKMGTGTNVQQRLVALHHLDAPWKPAEVEQRDGRILRQGNTNKEVAICRYVTEGSFDAFMWQTLETKARFIHQVMSGDLSVRQAEDISGAELSYAEVKAIASGNPAVLTLAEADAELKRLSILKKHHGDEQYLARRAMRELPGVIDRLERRITGLAEDMATVATHQDDAIMIDSAAYGCKEALEALAARLKTLTVHEARDVPLGQYRGLDFGVTLTPGRVPEAYIEGRVTLRDRLSRDQPGPRAVINAVERLVGRYEAEHAQTMRDMEIAQTRLRDFSARRESVFAHNSYWEELTGLRHQLEAALSGAEEAGDIGVIVEHIQTLKAAHTIEAAPERTSRPAASAAESVTVRIRHRMLENHEAAPEEADLFEASPSPPADRPSHIRQHTHRERMTRREQQRQDQMSLF